MINTNSIDNFLLFWKRRLEKVTNLIYSCRNRVLILNYHRITSEIKYDPFHMNVEPARFIEHLEILCNMGKPMHLSKLITSLKEGSIPNRSVVITFDDGYADNLYNAKPLLERYGIPATVFVTSGYVTNQREFWWDRLARLLFESRMLPPTLYLIQDGTTHNWLLSENIDKKEEKKYSCCYQWSIPKENNYNLRHVILKSIHKILRTLSDEKRNRVLDTLAQSIHDSADTKIVYYPVSRRELVMLVKNGTIEVGAHTVSHLVLSSLSIEEQYSEIAQSKKDLEEMLKCTVDSFAYPFGQSFDFTNETISIVKSVGFSCACTTIDGFIHSAIDFYYLPRRSILNLDGSEFKREIQRLY